MQGNVGIPQLKVTPLEAADQIFEHLDKNGDEKLSDLEFRVGAKHYPEILGLLQSGSPDQS